MLRLSERAFRRLLAGRTLGPSKFHNTRLTRDGQRFHSTFEADYYRELIYRQRAGEIRNLACQVEFPLEVNGFHICSYVADFVYEERGEPSPSLFRPVESWARVIDDTKSPPTRRTRDYRIKRKLMAALVQDLREVLRPGARRRRLKRSRQR